MTTSKFFENLDQCNCDNFPSVTHCIFDMDGLMLDTEGIYEEVYNEIANEYGKSYTKDLKLKIMGRPELPGANIFVSELGLPMTGEQFLAKFKPICMERLKYPKFLPGVEKLVRHLSQHKFPLALATSSNEDIAKVKMQNHRGVFDLFHHMVYGSSDPEVKKGKPDPDIYLICASRFPDNPDPKHILVFEDAPNGVQAAIDAGMMCVMCPDPNLQSELKNIMTRKPTLMVRSLENFKPELFGLPPFDNEMSS